MRHEFAGRVAARNFGFLTVYRYHPGKADWLAHALPIEGKLAEKPRLLAAARNDVPTCRINDKVGAARRLAEQAKLDFCVVTNGNRVILGILEPKALASDPVAPTEKAMRKGPSTYRPNLYLEDALKFIQEKDIHRVLVTNSEGELLGVLLKEDAERYLNQPGQPGSYASAFGVMDSLLHDQVVHSLVGPRASWYNPT